MFQCSIGSNRLLFPLIGTENISAMLKLERNALLIGHDQILLRIQEEETLEEGGENSTSEDKDLLIQLLSYALVYNVIHHYGSKLLLYGNLSIHKPEL